MRGESLGGGVRDSGEDVMWCFGGFGADKGEAS